jgi:hypothetical protein
VSSRGPGCPKVIILSSRASHGTHVNTASPWVLATRWETIRDELLSKRICDLRLSLRGSPVEPQVQQLYRELAAKKLVFKPACYLTDSWGCPNEVPVIGVPFYLASQQLSRLEEEQTGVLEDCQTIMKLLRHEAGHAINYAYRLWESPGWTDVFGPFFRPYRDGFQPKPSSRKYVRHLNSSQYGYNYAQKHPDEDFAETFAVWLTPRSGWRTHYRFWPAMRKLRYVERLMRDLRGQPPQRLGGALFRPVAELEVRLGEHYSRLARRTAAAMAE